MVVSASVEPSRRVELQLLGRSGRQGDPGTTMRLWALDDPFLLKYADFFNATAQLSVAVQAWAKDPAAPYYAPELTAYAVMYRGGDAKLNAQFRASSLEEDAILEVFRDKHYGFLSALMSDSATRGVKARAYVHACIQVIAC